MAASVIQEAVSGASLTAGSATTITASITISAGSRLKATAIGDTGTAATATFSDNSGQGIAWTSHGGPLNISNFRMFDGSSLQFPSGATITVTCTFASAMSTRGLLLQEIAGADNNAVQDAKSQTQNPLSSGTDVITTPSMTATGAGLVVGVTRNNGGANLTAGTGFSPGTLRWNGSGDPTLGESKHVAAGATASTWSTTSSGGAWWSTAVIFGDAAGAAPPAPSADPAPRLPPPKRARTTDFTVPPQQGVPGGTGFAPPERAVRAARWLPPPRIEVMPPMASAVVSPPPEAFRALLSRARRPATMDASMAPFAGPVPVVGLRLWLRGDLGVTLSGPNVVAWKDQSGFGNDVVNNGTVPFVASSINGRPGATFNGAWMENTSQRVLSPGSARTVFVVAKPASATGGFVFCNCLGTPGSIFGIPGTALSGLCYSDYLDGTRNVTVSPVPTINGVPLILEMGHAGTGTNVTGKLNGVPMVLSATNPVQADSGSAGFAIGDPAVFGGFNPVTDICEVLVYDSVLSAGDEAAVYACLLARYFPPPPVQFDAPVTTRRPPLKTAIVIDALPPVAAAAPPPPPPEAPRALPRRGPAAVAYQVPALPPPPVAAPVPPPPASFVVRVLQRARQWISEVGWPAVAAPPPGPSLPPPFTTVVDPVTLSTWVDSVQLTVSVDAVRLSLGERLKPRKTTDTYPITNTLLSNGVAVNLTGYTVTINIVDRASRTPKRANGACTLTDAVNGKVSYAVVAGDVDTAGTYDVEWKAVSGGGVPYHFPQDGYEPLEIQPALG